MLAKRIIPTILTKHGQMVKGKAFSADRVVGNALQAARIYAARGVDELCILDVTATKEGREPDYELIKALTDRCFMPLTVGGGVKTDEHVRKLLLSGADKVCLGSVTRGNHGIIKQLSEKYGRSTIVISMDVIGFPEIFDTVKECQDVEKHGAGEILLQHIRRDGTMEGYDLELIKSVSENVNIPVIASGGCSGYEDMYQAIQCGASAVAVGALFQFTDCTPLGAAEYLHNKGVEVRLGTR